MKQEINLGQIIRLGRTRQGWSQKQLAEIMGVRYNVISSWENNTRVPRGLDLIMLLEKLDIVSDIFPKYQKIQEEKTDISQEIEALWAAIKEKDKKILKLQKEILKIKNLLS